MSKEEARNEMKLIGHAIEYTKQTAYFNLVTTVSRNKKGK